MFSIRNPRAVLREWRASSGLAEPEPWLSDAWGGNLTTAGERVSVDSALAMADVFSAVNLIGEAIGGLPLEVYSDLSNSTLPGDGIVKADGDEAPEHRCYRMLRYMPNPFTPAMRFWSTITLHQLGWGNWFIEKLRGPDGLVSELRIVHPSRVVVYWNEAAGDKRYLVTRQSGEQVTLDDDRLLHGYGISEDGIIGLSPIQQSREAIGIVKARERFEGEALGQNPYASAAILHPGTVKDAKRIRESWRAVYGHGSKDRGSVAVLEEGATIQQLTFPMADLQFVESARLSKTQIANIFKLPPSYIGGSVGDSLTYQTVESNKIWLATQTLAPIAQNIASFLSRDFSLFPFQSWFCEFDLKALTRGDSAARTAYYKEGIADGWFFPDEAREEEGLPPREPPPPLALPAADPSGDQTTMAPVQKAVPVVSHTRQIPAR